MKLVTTLVKKAFENIVGEKRRQCWSPTFSALTIMFPTLLKTNPDI